MVKLVFNEVDINNMKKTMWSIFEKKETDDLQIKTGSTLNMNPEFEETTKTNYIKIADFDTFLSLNGKHESQVVQNAIEQGQFRSVNKIRKPNIFVVEIAKGGDVQDVQLVLDNLKKYKDSTDLLMIYTPFGTIEDLNLVGLDYKFSKGDGASLLIAKLTLQEIQSSEKTLEYTTASVKNPDNTNTQNVGEKSPKEVK